MTLSRLLQALLLCAALPAQPHVALVYPASRDPNGYTQTTPPCGGRAATASTSLVSSQKIDVQWRNQIGHPGYYRVSVASDASTFASHVIMTNIPSPNAVGNQNQTITLPDITCSHCILQFVQVNKSAVDKTTTSGYVEYVGCADIAIAPESSGTSPTTGASSSAGNSSATGSGTVPNEPSTTGGAAAGGSNSGGGATSGSEGSGSAEGGENDAHGCAAAPHGMWWAATAVLALVRRRQRAAVRNRP